MSERDEIVGEFLVESYENLDRLDADLVALEETPDARDRLSSVFRTIHTIKGTCGFLGFGKLESVTHVGESLLSKLRDGELQLDAELTSALLSMVDAVRRMLASIENSGNEGTDDWIDLKALLTSLLVPGKDRTEPARFATGPVPEASRPAADAASTAGSPAEKPTSPQPVRLGEVLVEQNLVSADKVMGALNKQKLGDPRRLGEIMIHEGDVTPSSVQEALQAQGEEHQIQAVIEGAQETTQALVAKPADTKNDASKETAGTKGDSSLRVDVALLDRLMNLVGELVLARNQVLQFTGTIEDGAFTATSQRLNLITTELQEGVMKTRMQPIGNVWSKLPRVVRDVSHQCGKRVRVEMDGKETELDKTIIEAIKDPLTHIVRNSIDHGIETPEARKSKGKPEEGRLQLRAYHEGGKVNIEISDDGAGINLEKIKEKAVTKGLIPAEQANRMSERDLLGLIFLPGFSTAAKVTNVSGRGVGMDVVKTNIEKIGGTVELSSQLDHGTTIRIKIPLTLAIIPALMVTSGVDCYAIPQVSLLELVRVERSDLANRIERVHGTPVYRLRGRLLPLVHLSEQLRRSASAEGDAINIVVLQADDKQFGLVVDEINDTEEIVVKPLGKYLKGAQVYAGATILGDGKVALILDVLGIAQRAKVIGQLRDKAVHDEGEAVAGTAEQRRSLLVARVGGSSRMAIELSSVARLEEIPQKTIEQSDGHMVVQYRGEILPLLDLAEALGIQRTDGEVRSDPIQVVVFTEGGRSAGLIVGEIVDIVDEAVTVKRRANRPELLGTIVIQNKVTDLLDVRAIIRAVDPSFFEQAVAA
jgi:two-component system chemotaxis sensor kinase CheA